jgi:hypothetical protein
MDHPPIAHDTACRNCSTPLTGPYCSQCGQHAHESARSLHVLFHDAWHLITHLDGRVWETLVPLMIRPGTLTQEYFLEHRARYVPPFRLYFIISVAFFALSSLTTSLSSLTPDQRAVLTTDRAELQRDLHAPEVPPTVSSTIDLATSNAMTPQVAEQMCGRIATGSPRIDRRLQQLCRHQVADQGKSLLHEFGSLVPKMMFVFLPLMALAMLAFYHSPPRYYVEHLVFLLHLQSALFLTMIVSMLFGAAADAWPLLGTVDSIAGIVLFWYCAWYVYVALRNYYGQSWSRTAVKFAAVAAAYLVCIALSLVGTFVISALVT